MSKKVRKPKRKLFNPDKIATAISQNLKRDLHSAKQMYGGVNDLQEFFSNVQMEAILKKYDSTVSDGRLLEEEAFANFRATNDRMGIVNANFCVRDLPNRHLSPLELTLKRARALVHWVLEDITWTELAEHASHSGGVTQGVKFSDTSLEAKFRWPMTTTTGAASLFEQYLSEDRVIKDAIEELNRHDPMGLKYSKVDASRATTVPKTSQKRRMIAIEPTLNMFFQQGLMGVMYKRLKGDNRLRRVGLDVESLPERHQELAWRGSVSGRLSTIDFSSASDCVSYELVRYLLPPSWFRYVDQLRCPSMNIDGENIVLNMVSTMGNAGTFPLETLVFWSIGVATIMQLDRTNPNSLLSFPEERDAVSVFGDDCILPTAYAEAFMANCVSLGFLVNEEKSFTEPGPGFRESCGGDYLRGSNVRPFSLRAPSSIRRSALEPWLYIILNGLLKKYIMYFGDLKYVYNQDTLAYIFGLFRRYRLKVKIVPPDFPDDSGLKTTDWRRLRACYDIELSHVSSSNFGSASFLFCKYQYWDKQDRNDYIRYGTWLRKPVVSKNYLNPSRDPLPWYNVRRRGSYIVARALSPNWEI